MKVLVQSPCIQFPKIWFTGFFSKEGNGKSKVGEGIHEGTVWKKRPNESYLVVEGSTITCGQVPGQIHGICDSEQKNHRMDCCGISFWSSYFLRISEWTETAKAYVCIVWLVTSIAKCKKLGHWSRSNLAVGNQQWWMFNCRKNEQHAEGPRREQHSLRSLRH